MLSVRCVSHARAHTHTHDSVISSVARHGLRHLCQNNINERLDMERTRASTGAWRSLFNTRAHALTHASTVKVEPLHVQAF